MTTKRKILVGLALVTVIGLMVFRAVRAESGPVVDVRAEVVRTRDLVARVSASGHIEPKRSVEIQSDVSGRIVELAVEEGEEVERDELLLRIDPTQFRAAVRQAEARLAEARAQQARTRADLAQYRRDWTRMEELKERAGDLVTDQEVERTRTEMEVQEAALEATRHAVDQAEAALDEARDRLDKTVIRSPMAGRVTRVDVEEGETAIVGTMNNPGSRLLTVADLSVMEAVVEVDETDVPGIGIGDSASVEIDAFPDTAFAGRVTKISDSSLQSRRAGPGGGISDEAVDFEVRVTLDDPPPGIRPDLSATADIVTDRREGALAIPIIALTLHADPDGEGDPAGEAGDDERGGEPREGVFVVEGDRVRFRPVEVGITGDNYFEVLEGLAAGDTVVSGTYQAIRELTDGSRVDVERVVPAGGAGATATRRAEGGREG